MHKFDNPTSLQAEGIQITFETPGVDEYRGLRKAAGLDPRSAEGAAVGLPNTFFAVLLRKQGSLIGMGRIVGDGGLTFQVVDIAIEPAYQGRGLGKIVVGEIVRHLQQTAPAHAHISLLADGSAKHLYAQFGFRETAPASIGMALPDPAADAI